MAKRNEKLREDAEVEDQAVKSPSAPKETPDGRKRKSKKAGEEAGRKQPDQALPGWAKARDAVRKKRGETKSAGEGKVTHSKFGMTVGGVVSKKPEPAPKSRFLSHKRTRPGGGFSSSRNPA